MNPIPSPYRPSWPGPAKGALLRYHGLLALGFRPAVAMRRALAATRKLQPPPARPANLTA